MNTENQIPRKYKRYDEAFKRSAVELWLQGGQSRRQIARELGISDPSLRQWKKPLAAWPASGLGQGVRSRRWKRRTGGCAARCATWRSSGTF